MKTFLFIVTACAIAAPVFSQSGQPGSASSFLQHTVATNSLSLLDSVIQYNNWSSTANNWTSAYKFTYSYNAHYKEEAEFEYYSSGSNWQSQFMAQNYTFDTNHNLVEKIKKRKIGSSSTLYSKQTYTYDGLNHMLTELEQNYSGGNWVNLNNLIYTYTGNNKTSYTSLSWNAGSAAWNNVSRILYTYNTNDQIISETEESWASGAWVNNTRNLNYVYTGSDLISYETERWNTTTSAYEPYWKTSNTYDANHRIQNGLIVIWNAATASWDNGYKLDYTYASNGTVSVFRGQTWDNASATWTNAIKIAYYYRTGYVGVNESSVENSAFALHPNPASDHITISTSANNGSSTVLITDLSGKTVLSYDTDQAGPFRINIQALQAGMYFMELRNEQGSANQKFIKQ
jgi:hypothetical protein